jgi:hypothetical protein
LAMYSIRSFNSGSWYMYRFSWNGMRAHGTERGDGIGREVANHDGMQHL